MKKRQFLTGAIASLCALVATKVHAEEVKDDNLPASMKKEIVLRALVETIPSDRDTVILSDGSIWEIDPMCSVDFVLWMEMDEVAVISGRIKYSSVFYKFTMVNFSKNKAISVKCVKLAKRE